MSAVKTAIRLSGEKGRVARERRVKGRGRRDGEEEAGRPTGGGRRRGSPGGSLRGRRRRVEDEVERMEREREREQRQTERTWGR